MNNTSVFEKESMFFKVNENFKYNHRILDYSLKSYWLSLGVLMVFLFD